ncbi:PepSY-associated TM helix domain-containing protein [Daejeonella oryzae]|uniref:PepSY-associated TM helix domain-containing protein n=1 Tax=Daejeonella oryzae TaxID=1122943 RepID=UPI00042666D4|nr:PepSY-associated TM helix domain-containing protein [Daejeonella oryzae]
MSKTFGKSIYKLHKWTGLIAGLFIFILGISGSVLVFHKEIEKSVDTDYLVTDNNLPVDIDKAYETIHTSYKNWEIRLEHFSNDPKETLVFGLRRPAERLTVFIHPANGNILKQADTEKAVVKWILKLHYSLHAGTAGKTIVFIVGLLFLLSLITGLIVYRKALTDILLFRIKFKQKNKKAFSSSLHRYVGVWAVLLNLIIVITGLLISYDVMIYGYSNQTVSNPKSPKINISLQKTLEILQKDYPDFNANYIRFPKAEGAALSILGSLKNQPFYYSKTSNSISVDPNTSEIREIKIIRNATSKDQIASISKAIHFVEFENIFIKLIFCLAGLSVPLLSITGFLLWKWKGKKSKK